MQLAVWMLADWKGAGEPGNKMYVYTQHLQELDRAYKVTMADLSLVWRPTLSSTGGVGEATAVSVDTHIGSLTITSNSLTSDMVFNS